MSDPDHTDAELMRSWIAGDERAYERIVTRYAPMIFNRCRRSLGAADADDATQAVFLVLAGRRDRAALAPVLAAWLMAVAGNVVRNAWRDRQRRQRAESAVPAPTLRTEEPIMPDAREHLDACLAQLPARERDAVVLHHLAGRTMAEVAAETGVHLNTVKYRIACGLERLRSLLQRRGVTVGAVALLACLQTEASAAMPADALAHVRSLPTSPGAGAQAATVSDRVRLWSRQGRPVRNALVAAGLLLVCGAVLTFLLVQKRSEPAAATASPSMHAVPVQGATIPVPAGPLAAIDPEQARTWIVMRANDGARTASRIRELPELALVPADQRDWLDAVASMRESVILIDQDSVTPRKEQSANYRRLQTMAALPRAERQVREQLDIQDALAKASEAKKKEERSPGGGIPAFQGWMSFVGEDPALIRLLRSTLDSDHPPIAVRRVADGWTCPVAGGEASIAVEAGRIVIGRPAAGAEPAAAVMAVAAAGRVPDADLEFHGLLDPGRPGVAPLTAFTGQLTIAADGLRLQASLADWGRTAPGPVLDRACFARIPAPAILAGAMAMRPDDTRGKGFWQNLLTSCLQPLEARGTKVPPRVQSALTAIGLAIDRCDGVLLAWLEPGMPIPVLTIEMDMPQDAGAAVIRATGMRTQDDGTAMVLAGPIAISLGWQDGRLIVTTNPGGIQAINRAGGFTQHEEVRRALAALPAGDIGSCALLRPQATLDLATPFGVMLKPDLQQPLATYRKRLSESKAFGYLSGSTDSHGYHIEAGGILALVGCAILAAQAADPAHQVRTAN